MDFKLKFSFNFFTYSIIKQKELRDYDITFEECSEYVNRTSVKEIAANEPVRTRNTERDTNHSGGLQESTRKFESFITHNQVMRKNEKIL